jgi:flagellar biosynthesis/type III secretory pathway chaperone
MAEEQEESQTNVVETTPGSRLTALQDPKKHPLLKTLKKLDRTCDEALEVLAGIMRDSTADVSNRRQAAQFLVDRKIQVAQEINKDSLARVIAESRMLLAEKQARREKVIDDNEDDDAPLVGYEPTVILKAPMDISNIKSL